MLEGGIEAIYWNSASKTEFGGPFWAFEIVDITTVDEVLLVGFGVSLPLRPELLGWLLMRIEVFDVDRHFGRPSTCVSVYSRK